MTVLDQANFTGEYHHPGRTYRRRPRFKIKKVDGGFVWISRKKKRMTKPAATRGQAKSLAKKRLKQIKLLKRLARRRGS